MRVDRMQIAVDLERDVLRGLHHVLDGDGLRLTREVVAALGAAHRVHQAGAPQAEEDLLNVVVRETFLLGELARRHRPLPGALGEVQGNNQTIFGPGGDAHTRINMRGEFRGFNGRGEQGAGSGTLRRIGKYRSPLPAPYREPPIRGLTEPPICTPNTFSPDLRCSHSRRALKFHIVGPLARSHPSPPCSPCAMPRSGPWV